MPPNRPLRRVQENWREGSQIVTQDQLNQRGGGAKQTDGLPAQNSKPAQTSEAGSVHEMMRTAPKTQPALQMFIARPILALVINLADMPLRIWQLSILVDVRELSHVVDGFARV